MYISESTCRTKILVLCAGKEKSMNDHEIIELYWQRSETAISATDKKYGKYCHTISYNILHNSEDAS